MVTILTVGMLVVDVIANNDVTNKQYYLFL